MDTYQPVREYFRRISPGRELSDDDLLLFQGIIDSAGMVDLLGFLEGEYQIKIDNDDITPDNFGSIDAIRQYLERKLDPANLN